MKSLKQMLKRLARDESGAEVMEYALVLGLVIVVAISLAGAVGGKVLANWTRTADDRL